ncbi:MAG: hypothetical protein IPN16_09690 [Gemmatimonadetes bacterium]|nr:hypothetical protein [Gemmatimonadota bacterium]
MTTFTRPVSSIDASTIHSLVENAVAGGFSLSTSATCPALQTRTNASFWQMSRRLPTRGGDIIFGIADKNDIAISTPGVLSPDCGPAILRLESLIRDGIAPRLSGVQSWPVPLTNDRSALVLRVPRSLASPHMVTYGNTSRFYGRNSRGKYQLDVHELRTGFLTTAAALDRARTFRAERVARIIAGQLPISLDDRPKVILHVVPLSGSALDPRKVVDLSPPILPLHTSVNAERVNLDGLLRYSPVQPRPAAHTYMQAFRDGALESVSSSLVWPDQDGNFIRSLLVERELIERLEQYRSALGTLEVALPYAAMISLCGVRGYRILPPTENRHWESYRLPLDEDVILLPEILLESVDNVIASALQPVFDILWQAAGWDGCLNYNADGSRRTR